MYKAQRLDRQKSSLLLLYRLALCLLSLYWLTACSDGDRSIKLDKKSIVLAFGDSLTQGIGTSPSDSYPSVLERKLGIPVINEGVSGETTAQGLIRLEPILKKYRPDTVILCYGGNDILQKLPESDIERNLERMINIIQAHNAKIILLGVPKPSLMLSPLPLYETLSARYDLVSDLNILSKLLGEPAMKSDRVHLNSEGYRALAVSISKRIEILN